MGTHGVTYADVEGVAAQLAAAGIAPTTRAVRDKLSRGSFSTIGQHLEAWRARVTATTSANSSLPPSIAKAISEYVDAKLTAAHAEHEHAVDWLQRQLTDALHAADTATQYLNEERSTNAALKAEAIASTGRAEELREALARMSEQLQREVAHGAERDKSAAVAAVERDGARREAAASLQQLGVVRENGDRLELQLHFANERIGNLLQEIAALEVKVHAAERRAAEAERREFETRHHQTAREVVGIVA